LRAVAYDERERKMSVEKMSRRCEPFSRLHDNPFGWQKIAVSANDGLA